MAEDQDSWYDITYSGPGSESDDCPRPLIHSLDETAYIQHDMQVADADAAAMDRTLLDYSDGDGSEDGPSHHEEYNDVGDDGAVEDDNIDDGEGINDDDDNGEDIDGGDDGEDIDVGNDNDTEDVNDGDGNATDEDDDDDPNPIAEAVTRDRHAEGVDEANVTIRPFLHDVPSVDVVRPAVATETTPREKRARRPKVKINMPAPVVKVVGPTQEDIARVVNAQVEYILRQERRRKKEKKRLIRQQQLLADEQERTIKHRDESPERESRHRCGGRCSRHKRTSRLPELTPVEPLFSMPVKSRHRKAPTRPTPMDQPPPAIVFKGQSAKSAAFEWPKVPDVGNEVDAPLWEEGKRRKHRRRRDFAPVSQWE
jgi:hypothetical protein